MVQSLEAQPVVEILESMSVAPNSVESQALVKFNLKADAEVVLSVHDYNGRQVRQLFTGKVTGNEVREVTFDRGGLPSGNYILRLSTSNGQSFTKHVMVN